MEKDNCNLAIFIYILSIFFSVCLIYASECLLTCYTLSRRLGERGLSPHKLER